jgi:hypothetical protein
MRVCALHTRISTQRQACLQVPLAEVDRGSMATTPVCLTQAVDRSTGKPKKKHQSDATI